MSAEKTSDNPVAPLPGEVDMLAAVVADMRDDSLKLIYADWLSERGDVRGEFLRQFLSDFHSSGKKRLPTSKPYVQGWRDVVGVTLMEGIRKFGLVQHKDAILGLARPTIALIPRRSKDEQLGIGEGKFGGCPDLPEGMDWPTWKKQPLCFLAQLNLAEIRSTVTARELPEHGLLSFFVFDDHERGMPMGEKGAVQILYVEETAALRRLQGLPGLSRANAVRPACLLLAYETLDLPEEESPWKKELKLGPDESERYANLRDTFCYSRHHLLGYSRITVVTEDPIPGADWRHLITFGSENNKLHWYWGDDHNLFFFVRERDLHKRRFQRLEVCNG